MMRAYAATPDGGVREQDPSEPLTTAGWIDLLDPSPADIDAARAAGFTLPSRVEMDEIELSSRLYRQNDATYATVVLPAFPETGALELGPVTFVLGDERFVTLRYHDPRPFRTFVDRSAQSGYGNQNAHGILLGLIEAVIDRIADILEKASSEVDKVSRQVLQRSDPHARPSAPLRTALGTIGLIGDQIGDIRLSLFTLERAFGFIDHGLERKGVAADIRAGLRTETEDVRSLIEHADFLSQKISVLLDAALGMISMEQNDIIKVFSVAAVVFLPPTLIATIYGMNFAHMPELPMRAGYPMALLAMLLSAIAPLYYFRKRGWL